MKNALRFAYLGCFLLTPALLHAQTGCINSPECPTAVLGLVGTAGAVLYARFRGR